MDDEEIKRNVKWIVGKELLYVATSPFICDQFLHIILYFGNTEMSSQRGALYTQNSEVNFSACIYRIIS